MASMVVLAILIAGGAFAASVSNLRQIVMAFHLYAGDNHQRLPDPVATVIRKPTA